ncbi:MAG: hypothetical protein LBF67_09230 [Prevotellaceae bacterium]|jgi:hypothetical protein|nr:hypothetical protein [Prevotellaceae bacterium]
MKRILKNQNIRIYSAGIALLSLVAAGIFTQGCSYEDDYGKLSDNSDSKFTQFEREFAESLSSDKNVIKLIGFKTYNISEEERDDFKKLVAEYGDEMRRMNNIVADDYSFFRIYFPLHTAIAEYEGKTYTADEKGLINIPSVKEAGKVVVIGRKKSKTVCGTGSNIVEKEKIRLKGSFAQKTQNGIRLGYSIACNACVFDLNALASVTSSCCAKTSPCGVPRLKSGGEAEDNGEDGDDSLEENGTVSCMQNHGGLNCSNAFGIHRGRCPFISSHCMDYNGVIPRCNDYDSIIGFVGSDCGVAVSKGLCWNEV